ncbi:MAG: DUF262 domain-containing protein [Verrucomicrobiae bacterium]|nr:DUF262 domain-containing protein [Verrucomicrobiae bacterium]
MKIESTDQDIRNLLASGYYRIPRFQRPYSWTRENIQDFWDDVVKDAPDNYFIGSMVTFKEGSQRYGVVDGQQRLTTITILLAVLRNRLNALGFTDLAQGIQNQLERKNINNKPEYILSTETSYPFFQDHILKFGEPEVEGDAMREEAQLRSGFEYLNELVGSIIKSVQSDTSLTAEDINKQLEQRLTKIRDAVLDLKVILVKLDDEDDAYIIFETLNTRGKDLSLADLVKNHVAKHLKVKSASVDQPKIKWENLLETIEGSSAGLEVDTFIHHFWLSRYDYLAAKRLFKVLKRRIGKGEAKTFLDALVADASLYRAVHEKAFWKWAKPDRRIVAALDALQLFRVEQQTPCVLSLMRCFKEKKLKRSHFEDAVVAIEKFHFLFTAVTSQRSSGGISEMYASLGRRLFEAKNTQSAVTLVNELKAKLRGRIPGLEEVKALIPSVIFTDNQTKQKNLVRYILAGFQSHSVASVTIDFDGMTIEHLLPQSEIGSGGFTDEIVGQLGNLILVPSKLNEKFANKSFKDKKRILLSAGVSIPTEFTTLNALTQKDIQQRTSSLAELAYKQVWKL